jgi:hypothetical protein
MSEVVNLNHHKERIAKGEQLKNLVTETDAVQRMINDLYKIEHYLMAIDKPPELVRPMVNLKARKCYLINKQTQLKG